MKFIVISRFGQPIKVKLHMLVIRGRTHHVKLHRNIFNSFNVFWLWHMTRMHAVLGIVTGSPKNFTLIVMIVSITQATTTFLLVISVRRLMMLLFSVPYLFVMYSLYLSSSIQNGVHDPYIEGILWILYERNSRDGFFGFCKFKRCDWLYVARYFGFHIESWLCEKDFYFVSLLLVNMWI